MSDLYLILRHRLERMTDWVMIDSAVLHEARLRLSLSREAVARQLPVSAKTYERWEKAGRVPRSDLARIAEILHLEVHEPDRAPLEVSTKWTPSDDLAAEILTRLDRIEQMLRDRPAC